MRKAIIRVLLTILLVSLTAVLPAQSMGYGFDEAAIASREQGLYRDNPADFSRMEDVAVPISYVGGSPLSPETIPPMWGVQTVVAGGDVGQHTSLQFDSQGHPHISYYDATNDDLRYAYHDGAFWHVEVTVPVSGVGRWNSLELDAGDQPHISYYDHATDDLKYAHLSGTVWISETVDSAGSVGEYTSLELDANDHPHISYYDQANGNLKYAYWDTGSELWVIEVVDDGGSSVADVGLYPSLARVASEPCISYYDMTNGDLKYGCRQGPDNWQVEVPYSGGGGGGDDVGQWTSLSYDASGWARISFCDATNHDLLIVKESDGPWSFQRIDYTDAVGEYTSVAVDASGKFNISYYDASNGNLAYIEGKILQPWDKVAVDVAGDVGQWTSLALDPQGYPAISYYDVTNGDLRYAWACSDPEVSFTYDDLACMGGAVAFTSTVGGFGPFSYLWRFGDGITSTLAHPTHTYSLDGIYTVTLMMTDTCGIAATYSDTVSVYTVPQAGFAYFPEEACTGETVSFLNTTESPLLATYMWDFGDGITSTLVHPVYIYGAPGFYDVILTATNSCGWDAFTDGILVHGGPTAISFAWEPLIPTVGSEVVFTAVASSTLPVTFTWDFGDSFTGTGQVITHTYTPSGTYTVRVTGSNNCGAITESAELTVVTLPSASFVSNSPVCLGEVMLFTNMSGGAEPLAHLWDFGDGVTSTLEHPTHLYAAAGAYTVTLAVTNPWGSDQSAQGVEVWAGVYNSAFTWEPPAPDPGGVVTFTAQAEGHMPITYSWDLGDGTPAFGQVVVHSYAVTGTYTVTFTTTNACGEEEVVEVIDVSFCTAPFGLAQEHSSVPIAGRAAIFTATLQAGDLPVTFAWDFGDGSSFEYGQVVQHTYAAPDTYTVTVAAWNDCGGPVYNSEVVQVAGQTSWVIYLPLVMKSFYGGDVYEEDDTPEMAKLLPSNTPQQRDFAPEGDEDWVYLDLQAGVEYYIQAHLLAEGVDTYVYLYTEGDYENALLENDDCGYPPPDNLAACITFTPTASGRYYLKITNHSGVWGQRAGYTLEAEQQ